LIEEEMGLPWIVIVTVEFSLSYELRMASRRGMSLGNMPIETNGIRLDSSSHEKSYPGVVRIFEI